MFRKFCKDSTGKYPIVFPGMTINIDQESSDIMSDTKI